VFIPAFSLGRTQELIYEMDRIFSDPGYQEMFPELQGKQRPPVFVDSPLGLKSPGSIPACRILGQRGQCIEQRGDHPIDFNGLYAVEEPPRSS
jgi:metallo-beta-lactamase family protein